MDASGNHGGGKVMRAANHIDHHLCFARIRHGWLENTHNGGRTCAEALKTDRPTEDRGVFFKSGIPEAIGEDRGTGSVGAVIAHVQQAPEDRVQAHHFEIIAADHARLNSARLAETNHGKAEDGEITELLDALDAGAQILDLGYRERGVVSLSSPERSAGCR